MLMLRYLSSLFLALVFLLVGFRAEGQCESYVNFGFTTSNQTVYFTMAPVLADDVTVQSVAWDLGDGNTSNIPNPIHTYDQADAYEACLRVVFEIHGESCVAETCNDVVIQSGLPCWVGANFGWVDSGQASVLSEAVVSAGSFTEISTLQWSLDGVPVSNDAAADLPLQPNAEAALCLTVYGQANNNNCSVTHCQEVEVAAPALNFTPSMTVKVEDDCFFAFIDNSILPPGAEFLSRSWELGDGQNSAAPQVLHSYEANGNYELCLSLEVLWYDEVLELTSCQTIAADCANPLPQVGQEVASDKDIAIKVENNGYGSTLVLEFTEARARQSAVLELRVFDLSGRCVMSSELRADEPLPLFGLPAGCYIAQAGGRSVKFVHP